MRFHAQHQFAGSAEAVIDVLLDPAFHQQLDLPDLARPDVVESGTDDGGVAVLRLRYEYVGQLDPLARRLLGDRQLTWLQALQVDRRTGRGQLTFAAEAAPDRLRGSGDVTIEDVPVDDANHRAHRSVRRLDGDLRVAIGPLGGMAERRIVPGLLRRLDIEAAAVDDRVS